MLNRLRIRIKHLVEQARSAALSRRWRAKRKPVSGLIRVRNGEEFLLPSAESIIALVDELVLVDNFSRDKTPAVIEALTARYPDKVRAFRYEHDVAPVGEDSAQLNASDPHSPRLAHNYSNWCIAKCHFPFVLKWDDDMIATDGLGSEMAEFRMGRNLLFEFGGHNIHSDLAHVLSWRAGVEPRVFPRETRFKMFDFGNVVGENSSGKYLGEAPAIWVSAQFTLRTDQPLYAHMKYCKRAPGSNQSEQFRMALEKGIQMGEPVPEEFSLTLRKYLGAEKL